jgi:hypothetical protein
VSVFRKQYRVLTEAEKNHVDEIKSSAEALFNSLQGGDPRNMALARTKLEECVMWAVKAIT